MLLINKEKNDIYEIKINSLDDLFILSQIFSKGDEIYSKQTRKIKIGEKQTTKTLFFEIKITDTNLENDTLKINGTILNETQFTQIGQFQSINLNIGNIFKFKKNIPFLEFEKKLFEKQITSKQNLNFLVLFDKDELITFEFSDLNYKFLFSEKNLGSKKNYYEINENKEKFEILKPFLNKDYENIILVSSNFYLKKFSDFLKINLKDTNKNKKIINLEFSQIDNSQIKNILKLINEKQLIQNSNLSNQIKIVDKFLYLMNKKKEKISYGEKEIFENFELGKIENLIFTTNFFSKIKLENDFSKFNNLILKLEKTKKKIHLINSKFECGEIVDNFKGIVSINLW
jgi:stalled ribosome rescue protein Dom34